MPVCGSEGGMAPGLVVVTNGVISPLELPPMTGDSRRCPDAPCLFRYDQQIIKPVAARTARVNGTTQAMTIVRVLVPLCAALSRLEGVAVGEGHQ